MRPTSRTRCKDSLFFSWGCTLASYTAGARGTPEQFTAVLGAGIIGDGTDFCSATNTTAGNSHPVTTGFSYWSCATHGGLNTIPSGYVTLATGNGVTPVIAIRESPVACVP